MNLRLKKTLHSTTFKSFKFYTDLFIAFQSAAGVIQPLAGLRKALSHDAPADKTIRVQMWESTASKQSQNQSSDTKQRLIPPVNKQDNSIYTYLKLLLLI